jgi:hypothetical protein
MLVPVRRRDGKTVPQAKCERVYMPNKALIAVFAGACLVAGPALGQQIDSAYTKINLDDCVVMSVDEMGGSWACPGYRGFPLYVAEGDLRMLVSYGFGAPDEVAASQTLPQFNTINDTLEWRLVKTEYGWQPFATILRFFTQSGDASEPDGQTLVVTKIAQGNTCHIAYIDARRVKNANALARQYADETAASFDCARDEPVRMPE